MKLLAKPPRIKVLEALGSIGDGRVHVINERSALVDSSERDRRYRVFLVEKGGGEFLAYSDDNGTIHRGYIGYPILAFMILRNYLPLDNELAMALAGIPWRELNTRYKNYMIVENIVLSRLEKSGVSRSVADDYINIVLKKLSLMKVWFDDSIAREA